MKRNNGMKRNAVVRALAYGMDPNLFPVLVEFTGRIPNANSSGDRDEPTALALHGPNGDNRCARNLENILELVSKPSGWRNLNGNSADHRVTNRVLKCPLDMFRFVLIAGDGIDKKIGIRSRGERIPSE